MQMYIRTLAVTMLLLAVFGCTRAPETAEPDMRCSSCESNGWGRVIFGRIAVGDAGSAPELSGSFEYPNGMAFDVDPKSCHELPPPYVCTFMAYAYPAADSVKATFKSEAWQTDITVKLAKFNYCGREIAYVPILVEAGKPPKIGEISYISPCGLIE
jgi:hypothetical protein